MTGSQHIRILFFSDTHLGFDSPLKPRIRRRRRGEDFFANCDRALRAAVEQRADLVIHGGDLFFRARIPRPIVDRVYARLREFTRHGIPLLLVPGNHEFSRFPDLYRLDHPLISVFTRPRTFVRDIR
ncbi:MAG: metallophosphoesterase, partial [FCB group bacterium]|nr:metallophosphoesterase [FCB group bacterium]